LPELARQEYECSWDGVTTGSVWGELLSPFQLTEFEPSNGRRVYASYDLGSTDATSIWLWYPAEGGIEIVDYIEATRKPLQYYWDELALRGWEVITHYLPHDAKARTLQSSQTIRERFAEHYGWGKVDLTPNLSVLEGIQAVRYILQRPIKFHAKVEEGMQSLQGYHYEYNEERKVFSMKPVHDWASHGSDAFRYLAIVSRKLGERAAALREKERAANMTVDVPRGNYGISLDQLWADRDSALARRGKW
jgi:phage terminase large subunit